MAWSTIIAGAAVPAVRVGADLGPYPYISGFGILLRMARLGVLQGADLSALGLRNRSTTDVLAATQQARAPRHRLVEALGLGATTVATYWPVEVWSPARMYGALDQTPGLLRRCMACAEHGYHTALFQLHSITHCPWHGEPLVTACPACGKPAYARFDAKCRLGRCTCGHDPFKVAVAGGDMWSFPTQAADAWLSQYEAWARVEREQRGLLLPEAPDRRDRALKVLVPPPRLLQPPAAEVDPIEVFGGPATSVCDGAFRGWSLLGGDRPLTFVPLPAALHARLADATLDVVRRYPSEAGTPLELVYSRDFQPDAPLEANVVNRPDCFIAPFATAGEDALWLNVSAVDPLILVFCGRLLARMESEMPLPEGDTALDRSPAVAQSERLQRVEGAQHLLRALEALLVQGYRQGLDTILRSMGKLDGPVRGSWLTPSVEIVGEPGVIWEIRLCWVAGDAPALKRTVEVPVNRPGRAVTRRGKHRGRRLALRRRAVRIRR